MNDGGLVVLDCDSGSIDNVLSLIAATHPDSGLDVRLGIVHSRYLYHDDGTINQQATDELARYMAATIQGMLRRMGRMQPVFIGLPFHSVMGPKQHADETAYDLCGDGNLQQPAGDFAAAMAYLRRPELRDRRIHIINAGPAHGVVQIMADDDLFGRLGYLVTQGGVLDLPDLPELDLVGGPGKTYNWVCALEAARTMMRRHPDVSVITSTTTKSNRLGMTLARLRRMRIHPVLAAPYRGHFRRTAILTPSRKGKPLYVHDLHLVLMLRQLLLDEAGPYTWAPFEMDPPVPWTRWLVTGVNARLYFQLMRRFTCN